MLPTPVDGLKTPPMATMSPLAWINRLFIPALPVKAVVTLPPFPNVESRVPLALSRARPNNAGGARSSGEAGTDGERRAALPDP
jgi:hypothetical protein